MIFNPALSPPSCSSAAGSPLPAKLGIIGTPTQSGYSPKWRWCCTATCGYAPPSRATIRPNHALGLESADPLAGFIAIVVYAGMDGLAVELYGNRPSERKPSVYRFTPILSARWLKSNQPLPEHIALSRTPLPSRPRFNVRAANSRSTRGVILIQADSRAIGRTNHRQRPLPPRRAGRIQHHRVFAHRNRRQHGAILGTQRKTGRLKSKSNPEKEANK